MECTILGGVHQNGAPFLRYLPIQHNYKKDAWTNSRVNNFRKNAHKIKPTLFLETLELDVNLQSLKK